MMVPMGNSRLEVGRMVTAAKPAKKNAVRFQRYDRNTSAASAATTSHETQSARVPLASGICA